MKKNNLFAIGMIANCIPFLPGIFFYHKLPDIMAVHFGRGNHPNGFLSKDLALFGIPVFMIIVYAMAYFVMVKDPKSRNHGKEAIVAVLLFVPLLNILTNCMILLFNMGSEINTDLIVRGSVSVFLILLGNYLPKIKNNYTIGIKTPWTLADDEVWNQTHRMAGYMWIMGGFVMLPCSFFSTRISYYIFIGTILMISVVPIMYSYLVYSRKNKGKT